MVLTDHGAVLRDSRSTSRPGTFVVPLRLDHAPLGVVDGCGPPDDVVMRHGASIRSRIIPYTVVGTACAALLVHVVGWGAAASVLWWDATPHVPHIQSAIVLSLGLLTIRVAASAGRRTRRLIVVAALAVDVALLILARFAGFEVREVGIMWCCRRDQAVG